MTMTKTLPLRLFTLLLAGGIFEASLVGCGGAPSASKALPVEEQKSGSPASDTKPANASVTTEVEPSKPGGAGEGTAAPTETVATEPENLVENSKDQGSETAAAPPKGSAPTGDGPPAGGRPLADREKPKPGEAHKISFDDLIIGMQADIPYRPWMMEGKRPEELNGQKVRISGLMHGGAAGQNKIKEFVLLRNLECKFGPGGQADHLARIQLAEGEKTQYTIKTVIVEGRLNIEPYTGPDGNTWAIYRIDEAKLK